MNTHHTTSVRCITKFIVAVMLTTMAACHVLKPVAEPPVNDSVVTEGSTTPTAPRTLSVTTFTATVNGASVNGQLRIASDSLMWVSVTKIIELGRALATPDSVWVNVPMAGRYYAANYAEIGKRAKRHVSFAQLQDIATADDAEQQIEELARQLGIEATVHITRRQTVQRLTFPFSK